MIAAKLLIPKKTRNGIHTIKKMKLILFCLLYTSDAADE